MKIRLQVMIDDEVLNEVMRCKPANEKLTSFIEELLVSGLYDDLKN